MIKKFFLAILDIIAALVIAFAIAVLVVVIKRRQAVCRQ